MLKRCLDNRAFCRFNDGQNGEMMSSQLNIISSKLIHPAGLDVLEPLNTKKQGHFGWKPHQKVVTPAGAYAAALAAARPRPELLRIQGAW